MQQSQWQQLILKGNQHFDEQQLFHAEDCYLEAYETLTQMAERHNFNVHNLMAWISVCHNLSSVYEWLGESRNALRYLMIPHKFLSEMLASNRLDEDMEFITYRGLSLTLPPILVFAQKNNICGDCLSEFPGLEDILSKTSKSAH